MLDEHDSCDVGLCYFKMTHNWLLWKENAYGALLKTYSFCRAKYEYKKEKGSESKKNKSDRLKWTDEGTNKAHGPQISQHVIPFKLINVKYYFR